MFIDTEDKPKTRAPEERHVVSTIHIANISLLRSCENYMELGGYKYFVHPGLVVTVKNFAQTTRT